MTTIAEIEGIGEAYAAKLKAAEVGTVEALLEAGGTPKGRDALSQKTGISPTLVLKWVNRADLHRVKGIGSEYADLLEASGVDTVVELSKRKADNLFAKMTEVNGQKKLVRKLPTQDQVGAWIEQAKALPRMVSY